MRANCEQKFCSHRELQSQQIPRLTTKSNRFQAGQAGMATQATDPWLRRLKKEAEQMRVWAPSMPGVSAEPISEDMKRWKGTITMPEGIGGSYTIDIELTDYPASILKSPLLASFTL
jgi:hypothetical protein